MHILYHFLEFSNTIKFQLPLVVTALGTPFIDFHPSFLSLPYSFAFLAVPSQTNYVHTSEAHLRSAFGIIWTSPLFHGALFCGNCSFSHQRARAGIRIFQCPAFMLTQHSFLPLSSVHSLSFISILFAISSSQKVLANLSDPNPIITFRVPIWNSLITLILSQVLLWFALGLGFVETKI